MELTRRIVRQSAAALALALLAPAPGRAQAQGDLIAQVKRTQQPEVKTGSTAQIGAGQVGQRQRSDQAAPSIKPTERIASRIENRVQTRIRNRIDETYDPMANATSPFKDASEQARKKVVSN